MKKIIPLLLNFLNRYFPKYRGVITRKLFHVDLGTKNNELNSVSYEVASTYEDYMESFRLVQNNYKRLRMTRSDDFLRATKYNLLPTTTVIIAKYNDEVIATITLIIDSSIGLPIDEYQDISNLRSRGGRIVEIGALTVKEEWRSKSRGLFIPLSAYCVKYAHKILGCTVAVCSLRKSVQPFYEDIFCFRQFGETKKYEGVNNLESVSLFAVFEQMVIDLRDVYGNAPFERNCYRLLKEFPWRNQCDLEVPKYRLITKHLLTDSEMKSLFKVFSNVLSELDEKDKSIIKNYYQDDRTLEELRSALDEVQAIRKHPRFHVNLRGKLTSGTSILKARILDVSAKGVSIYTRSKLEESSHYYLIVELEKNISVKLKLQKMWSKKGNRYGFLILEVEDRHWNDMIQHCENYLFGEASKTQKVHKTQKKKLA